MPAGSATASVEGNPDAEEPVTPTPVVPVEDRENGEGVVVERPEIPTAVINVARRPVPRAVPPAGRRRTVPPGGRGRALPLAPREGGRRGGWWGAGPSCQPPARGGGGGAAPRPTMLNWTFGPAGPPISALAVTVSW